MTTDLEETLDELGPEYRAVVARLRGDGVARPVYLRAAALALLLFLPCAYWGLSGRTGAARSSLSAPESPAPREYVLALSTTPDAVAELVRTQRADGGWANDFLTRQNARALKDVPDAPAQLAYRKAMRNLRVRGVL